MISHNACPTCGCVGVHSRCAAPLRQGLSLWPLLQERDPSKALAMIASASRAERIAVLMDNDRNASWDADNDDERPSDDDVRAGVLDLWRDYVTESYVIELSKACEAHGWHVSSDVAWDNKRVAHVTVSYSPHGIVAHYFRVTCRGIVCETQGADYAWAGIDCTRDTPMQSIAQCVEIIKRVI